MNMRRRPAGFTLLELLVSLVMFALLATALHQCIGVASRAARASAASAGGSEQQRTLVEFLQRHLSQAMPVLEVDGGRPRLLFHGDEERLVFVTLLPVLAGFAGPAEVALETPSGARGMLEIGYRALSAERAEKFGGGDYESHSLGVEVGGLSFGYYGAADRGSPAIWHDRWRDERRMPQAVRVSLRMADGEEWPEVVVMLRMDANAMLRRRAAVDGAPAHVVAQAATHAAEPRP